MEIISFTGKAGTGKSYQATKLCSRMNIEAIIDDGLLIYKNRIVAGSSAKKCTSKAKAMRTALFDYEEQRNDVCSKLEELKPQKLLILGTSVRMVNWITDALGLPRAEKHIYIEDVTTEEERAVAHKSRVGRGEHVIPVPVGQIRRDFAGYFIDPVRVIKGFAMDGPLVAGKATDRTVVRPSFSYFGEFVINDNCIKDLIDIVAEKHAGKLSVMGFFHNGNAQSLGVVIEVMIRRIPGAVDCCKELQRDVAMSIEKMMSFNVSHVNIQILDVVLPGDNKKKQDRFEARKGAKNEKIVGGSKAGKGVQH